MITISTTLPRSYGRLIFGVCLLCTFAGVAFATPEVQAAKWKIAGSELKTSETITGSADTSFLLEFKVGASSVIIHCSKLALDNGLINTGGTGSGIILLSECETLVESKASPVCKLEEPVSATVRILLILNEATTFMLFEPFSGTTLMTLKIANFECVLPEEMPITGSAVAECPGFSCDFEVVTRLISFSEATEKTFTSDTLKFGKTSVSLRGSANLQLSGPNKGKVWSAIG